MTDETKPWWDDDSFWETFGQQMFTPERWDKAPIEVDGVVRFAGLEPPARVLDLCCGPGRHTLELTRRGFQVTGVDRSDRYVAAARERAASEGLEPELVRMDMREFVREGAFDCALNLFTSFGYFDDPKDDARVLEQLHRSLRPGGTLVLELMGREVLARKFQPRDWNELPDGTLMLQDRRVADGWTRMDNRWIHVGPKGMRS